MHRALAAGFAGLRSNLIPGLILWAVGSALLALYWLVPAARPPFDQVAGWQETWGLAFSGALVAVAGGLIPFLVMRSRGRIAPGRAGATLLFLVLFWIWRGIEVDLFYQLQSWLFGDGRDVATLAKKLVVDQFLYTALWTIPTTTLAFTWFHDCRADWAAFRKALDREFWTVRLPGMIIAAWMVWIPMVCIINAIPAPLRVAILAIATVFWTLCIDAVSRRNDGGGLETTARG